MKKPPGDRFGFSMRNDPLIFIEAKDEWADQSSRLGSCKGRLYVNATEVCSIPSPGAVWHCDKSWF